MQGMIRCGLVAGLLVACHTSDPATPDGAMGDGGGSGAAGMHVRFATEPSQWPGAIEDGFTLETAVFKFDNLRVIGDAGPGDPRTTDQNFELKWDAQDTPPVIDFADAPTGLYSKVSFQIDGHLINPSYVLKGHVSVAGTSYPFMIEDRNSLSLSLDCNRMLAPGASVTVGLKIKFIDALKNVNWTQVRTDNGRLELDTTDSQISAFRSNLTDSFSIDNSGPN